VLCALAHTLLYTLSCTCALGGPVTSTRNKVNKFVSTVKAPPLHSLQWSPVTDKNVRHSKVWEFMGVLFVVDATTGRRCPFDDSLLHCKLCFHEQVSAGKDGHVKNILCKAVDRFWESHDSCQSET